MRIRRMQLDDLERIVAAEESIHEAPWTRGNFLDVMMAGYDAWIFEREMPDGQEADGQEAHMQEVGRHEAGAHDAPLVTPENPAEAMIGYAVVMWLPDEVHVLTLGVCIPWQGRGHGRAILQWLLTNIRERGAGAVMLEVRPSNLRAVALYRSVGFMQIGRRRDYYPSRSGREDALVLYKRLAAS